MRCTSKKEEEREETVRGGEELLYRDEEADVAESRLLPPLLVSQGPTARHETPRYVIQHTED